MERFLTEYINRLKPYFTGFPVVTAHEIASVFLAFKFGLFRNAVHECIQAISLIPDNEANRFKKSTLNCPRKCTESRKCTIYIRPVDIFCRK